MLAQDTQFTPTIPITRTAAISENPDVLADIYKDNINMAIWQRELPMELRGAIAAFIEDTPRYREAVTIAPNTTQQAIFKSLKGAECAQALSEHVAELVDMFCYLFELKQVGLRLATLDRAMCPKFHVDRVPCRMLTTFQGVATEWLAHDIVDRSKLGAGSAGLSDADSGIYPDKRHIQQLHCGDVAILKGETWHGNENAGLVHRSPLVPPGTRRLVMTLDYMN